MAYSFVRYVSAGSVGPYSVPFDYRSQSDVTVTVNGASVPFTWATSSTINLDTAPAIGATIEIKRTTSEATRLTQYQSNSQISQDNLEQESIQSFNLAQEALDAARDAKGKSIRIPDGEADLAALPAAATRASKYLGFDATGALSLFAGAGGGGGGGGAPTTASYLVLNVDATLTAERVLTAGTGITMVDGGAGSTLTLSIANNAITDVLLSDMPQFTVKGRVAAGTGDPKNLTAAELISVIATADGAGSGLDADTVDGLQASAFLQTARQINTAAGLEGGGDLSTDRTIGIAGGGVVNNMLSNMAPNTIKGRFSSGVGSPEDITAAQLVQIITAADGSGSGLDADTLDGLNSTAFALSGNAITAGAGLSGGGDLSASRTLTIATNGVTNSMLATMNQNTIKGRVSTGVGNAEDLTPSQVVQFLLSADGASSGLDADLLDGFQATDFLRSTQTVTTTAPLTGGGQLGSNLTIAIAANGITNNYLGTINQGEFHGRASTGNGNVENITATQATALLNAMVGATAVLPGTKGLVPAPAAGQDTYFLRGDGTWAAGGAGSGGGAPISSKFISYGVDAGLSDERVLAGEASVVTITDSGTSGGNITVGLATNGVSNGKMATMATQTIKGRVSAGTGSPEDLTAAQATSILNAMVGANGTVAGTKGLVPQPAATDNVNFLRGDGTWAAPSGSGAPTTAQYVTLAVDAVLTSERVLTPEASVLTLTDGGAGSTVTLGIAANGVTNAKLRQGAALSVIGNATNLTANVADIAASVDGQVLRRSGTALGFGTVATAGITDAAITYAKIQNVTTQRLLGRTTALAGVVEELTVTSPLTLVAGSGTLNFDQTAVLGNNARVAVLNNAAAVGTRRGINFVPGTNITYSIADDSVNERVNVTINAAGGGGGAPTTASYLTLGTDATLTAERVLTAGTGITLTDGGAGLNATLALDVNGLTAAPATVSGTADFVPIYSANAAGVRKLPLSDVRAQESIIVACSDETTAGITLSTSVPKVTFRMPYAFNVTKIKASLNAAQATGATLFTVDVKKNGTSVFTTQMTFDNTELTTETAATASVLTATPTAFAADDVVTIFVSNNTAGNVAAGLKVTMIGWRG